MQWLRPLSKQGGGTGDTVTGADFSDTITGADFRPGSLESTLHWQVIWPRVIAKAWEDKAWAIIKAENEMGLICSSGEGGTCTEGKPSDVKRVKATDADKALLDKALNDVVLKRWSDRCGAACAKKWNETVGKVTNLTAG